ncbi:Hypothetical protein A7982_09295 [Minicystis rosea]|nr:Hypothetical protein A7982_09295 [Minicystis rosea]
MGAARATAPAAGGRDNFHHVDGRHLHDEHQLELEHVDGYEHQLEHG